MTLQEAKDQVAKMHGFDNFQECYFMGLETSTKELLKYADEAAELYAKSKWEEACEATLIKCSHRFHDMTETQLRIMSVLKPEFKP